MLAESKLNTISDHISKALIDGQISDEEYSLVFSELEKFNKIRDEIRTKIRSMDEETKQALIAEGCAKGREDAITSFQNMFGKSRSSFRKNLGSDVKTNVKTNVKNER